MATQPPQQTPEIAAPKPTETDSPEEAHVVEAEGQVTVSDITPTMDIMDRTILIASKLEEYGRARAAIMNFIIKQSYPNDWVSHSLESVPKLDRTANMGAAGCERIASLLGIKEFNWTKPVKEWTDNRLHFSYVTQADFEFAGRRIHVNFRVGTRDKFWRVEYVWNAAKREKERKMIPLEDVREDYIEKASFRGTRKEGIRTLLGLRNVPLMKLVELGFNVEHVHYASFKPSAKKTDDSSGKVLGAREGDGKSEYTLNVKEISQKLQGKKGPYFVIVDISGDKFYLHADETSDRLKTLQAAAFGEYKVRVKYRENNNYKTIDEVVTIEGEESK